MPPSAAESTTAQGSSDRMAQLAFSHLWLNLVENEGDEASSGSNDGSGDTAIRSTLAKIAQELHLKQPEDTLPDTQPGRRSTDDDESGPAHTHPLISELRQHLRAEHARRTDPATENPATSLADETDEDMLAACEKLLSDRLKADRGAFGSQTASHDSCAELLDTMFDVNYRLSAELTKITQDVDFLRSRMEVFEETLAREIAQGHSRVEAGERAKVHLEAVIAQQSQKLDTAHRGLTAVVEPLWPTIWTLLSNMAHSVPPQ